MEGRTDASLTAGVRHVEPRQQEVAGTGRADVAQIGDVPALGTRDDVCVA